MNLLQKKRLVAVGMLVAGLAGAVRRWRPVVCLGALAPIGGRAAGADQSHGCWPPHFLNEKVIRTKFSLNSAKTKDAGEEEIKFTFLA